MKFNGKECYSENIQKSAVYKKMYLNSINNLIQSCYEKAKKERDIYITPEKLSQNKAFYRDEYKKLIGFPFFENLSEIPKVKKEFIAEDEMSRIYRLSVETMPGFWFYGLLFVPLSIKQPAPLVIAQHGGGGTPEFCCDMYGENNYSNFSKRALEEGMVVFAPQLLLWSFDVKTGEKFPVYDIEFSRNKINNELNRFGLSITGLEVFSITRCIDYLETLDFVDREKIGMTGLSYGGFFSLHTAAADERIKSVYDAASFNDRSKVFLGDWVFYDDLNRFNEGEIAGLCAPRNLIIDVGREDAVFDFVPSVKEAERAKKYYEFENAGDKFTFNLWNGGHKFDIEGKSMDKFFKELKGE